MFYHFLARLFSEKTRGIVIASASSAVCRMASAVRKTLKIKFVEKNEIAHKHICYRAAQTENIGETFIQIG